MKHVTKQHLGIAGAGLVGRVLALKLLAQGHRVTLFEKDSDESENAAARVAAGMLAPFAELETAESDIFDLGQRSIQIWPGLLEQLSIPDALQQAGSVITAHPADMAELERFMAQLRAKAKSPDSAESIQALDPNALQRLEPDLSHHSRGFFLPSEGQVNAQRFMDRSRSYLREHPEVIWHTHAEVTDLKDGCIHVGSNPFTFDWAFDTRGLGAKKEVTDLRGVRGEVFWLDAPDVKLTRPVRLMHPRYRIYIVPRPSADTPHRYVIGATEIESEDMSPMSVRSSLELLSAAYSLHPGFGEARIVNSLTNCRPALDDNLPSIRHEPQVTRINGLYRHGYLLTPAVVEQALMESGFATADAA
ncbi:FAD-dependent oxidoreductase [Thiomicrospira sp. S5]|uniref:FAD-dependent oxidoreductase n=1 Tax=Thiomicrospira sp. S5 TaxID=1803865 RepID=UPI000F8A1230|nr:FAD-dependent oxidoreductase [Thiomicrospira sp. S5]AZR83036.1 FAD-dependent oxidoreductase [Thiomicrospira sp. S5]